MVRVGIMGATGYTGIELVKILKRHPAAEIAWLTTESHAGQKLSDVFACPWDMPLIAHADADLKAVDVVFLCLPHGASMQAVRRVVEAGTRAIDLSADFRLSDPADYTRWYKEAHLAPELLPEAVYGLTELHREQVRSARLVANPGCYPTSVILGLYPLVTCGLLAGDRVIVDAKSGVSGAGRGLSLKTHFVEAHDNFSPYSIGHSHRHISEMEQELNRVRGWGLGTRGQASGDRAPTSTLQPQTSNLKVIFSPHLLPLNQGILSTMYVDLVEPRPVERLLEVYRETYARDPFVQVLPAGQLASLRHVTYSNRCAISLTDVDGSGQIIVCSAIDNLVKGASGQAVQNMNVMFGLDETSGLL